MFDIIDFLRMANEEFATSLEQNDVIKFFMLLRFNDHTVL